MAEPSAVQVAAAGESQATPAYYVPPAASPQPDTQTPPAQEPAAQVPPGWSPPQPYLGQWPQPAPAAPQPYGGQQFPSQPPPQPTSVQGQWQWVPQQPPGPQSAGQQEPPTGYPPPPQGVLLRRITVRRRRTGCPLLLTRPRSSTVGAMRHVPVGVRPCTVQPAEG